MGKFNCICGDIIRVSGPIPHPDEWLMIADTEYDSLDPSTNLDDLYKKMKSLIICRNCGRLWVFWDGFGAEPTVYKKDED